MNKKVKALTLTLSILLTILILSGVSYAFFVAGVSGNETSESVVSNTSTLSLTYDNGTGNITGTNLTVGWSASKTFSVTNTGNNIAYYDIAVSDVVNTLVVKEGLTISYTGTNGGASLTERIVPGSNQSLSFGIEIGTGITHNYTVNVYYKNLEVDQTGDIGKTFSFKIGIKNSLNPNSKMLLTAKILGVGNENVTTSLTTPGRQISLTNEAVLASTTDDYGTSYYFRGSVENNYVLFANMCWRIVRITGDGSIKLVLYNYNTGTNSCNGTGSSYAFARYTGTTYTSAFNSSNGQNAYIGFMYGTPGSSTYEAEHNNTNKSTILTNLEAWYNRDSKFVSYESMLADTIWCNDKSVDTAYVYGTTLGYAEEQTGYSARGRLTANGSYVTTANPSLICPDAGSDNKLSKFSVSDKINGNEKLTNKIGLLTADEVAFAGGMYNSENSNSTYYLNKNANGSWWWSLSPSNFASPNAYVWGVYAAGYLYYINVGNSGGLRPSISLTNQTLVTGSGTSSNPYKIV